MSQSFHVYAISKSSLTHARVINRKACQIWVLGLWYAWLTIWCKGLMSMVYDRLQTNTGVIRLLGKNSTTLECQGVQCKVLVFILYRSTRVVKQTSTTPSNPLSNMCVIRPRMSRCQGIWRIILMFTLYRRLQNDTTETSTTPTKSLSNMRVVGSPKCQGMWH